MTSNSIQKDLQNDLYTIISPPNPLIQKNSLTQTYYSHPQTRYLLISLLSPLDETSLNSQDQNDQILPHQKYRTLSDLEKLQQKILRENIVYRKFPVTHKTFTNSSILDVRKLLNSNSRQPYKAFSKQKTFYTPSQGDHTLVFQSRFQSGNLALAIKESDKHYILVLQNDVNTKGYTQWFYFKVQNTFQKMTVKFSIVNLSKRESLHQKGMKILIYSQKQNQNKSKGWFRGGKNIQYISNFIKKPNLNQTFNTLSFFYTFKYNQDTVFFAHSYPYTYSDLMADLRNLSQNSFLKRKSLCKTLAGNRCQLLTIDSESKKQKKGVIFSSRVHPGETVGSWVMKGIINFLTGPSIEAQKLRQNFSFKLIPMLNPDGVIYGNYRCSLLGVDLNRRWNFPNQIFHPTVFHCKKLIKAFVKEKPVSLICDLHGHSRKKNTFIYGCELADYPQKTRKFPFTISKLSSYFNYQQCIFSIQRSKQATMRVSLFKQTKVPATYTCQTSFFGPSSKQCSQAHFLPQQLMEIGETLCKGLFVFCQQSIPVQILNIEESDQGIFSHSHASSSGSDSAPSQDKFDPEQLDFLIKEKERQEKKTSRTVFNSFKTSRRRLSRSMGQQKEQPSQLRKCYLCGRVNFSGHSCLIQKFRGRTLPRNIWEKQREEQKYINLKGKQVRDQGCQTVPVNQREKSTPILVLTSTMLSSSRGVSKEISSKIMRKGIRKPVQRSSFLKPDILPLVKKQAPFRSPAWKISLKVKKK